MNGKRSLHATVTLPNGRILVAGGWTHPDEPIITSVEVYDPGSNSWSYADHLDNGRYEGLANLLSDGTIFVVGGTDFYTYGSLPLEVYGPDSDGDGYNDAREGHLGENTGSYCQIMRADVISDGVINAGDQLRLITFYLTQPVAQRMDQTGDNRINSGDQLKMALNFGKNVGMCP
jgi:hypothetical protein